VNDLTTRVQNDRDAWASDAGRALSQALSFVIAGIVCGALFLFEPDRFVLILAAIFGIAAVISLVKWKSYRNRANSLQHAYGECTQVESLCGGGVAPTVRVLFR
jgi:hypothetical protein